MPPQRQAATGQQASAPAEGFCEEAAELESFRSLQKVLGQAGSVVGLVCVSADLYNGDMLTSPFWQSAYLMLGLATGGFAGVLVGAHFPLPFAAVLVAALASSYLAVTTNAATKAEKERLKQLEKARRAKELEEEEKKKQARWWKFW